MPRRLRILLRDQPRRHVLPKLPTLVWMLVLNRAHAFRHDEHGGDVDECCVFGVGLGGAFPADEAAPGAVELGNDGGAGDVLHFGPVFVRGGIGVVCVDDAFDREFGIT